MRAALRFGLPLLLNGIALAAAYQLDRMAVGAWLGVLPLGIYVLSVTLLLQPIALLTRLATATLQPRLSAAWHAAPSVMFQTLVRQLARYSSLISAVGAAATVCLGAPMLRLMCGPGFATSDAFFVLMGGVVLVRLHRYELNLIGLGAGRTRDMMVSNVVGATALPAIIGAFYISPGLISAAIGTLVGEVLAFVVLETRLTRHCFGTGRIVRHGMTVAAVLPTTLGVWVLLSAPPLWLRMTVIAATLLAAASIILARRVSRNTSIVAS